MSEAISFNAGKDFRCKYLSENETLFCQMNELKPGSEYNDQWKNSFDLNIVPSLTSLTFIGYNK